MVPGSLALEMPELGGVDDDDSIPAIHGDMLRSLAVGQLARRSVVERRFGTAISGTTPFAMPRGATPGPPSWADELRVRVPAGGNVWYREAHNDDLQLLVETGVPGLLLALWAAASLVRHLRGDPWLPWSVTAVLLVTLLAARRERHRQRLSAAADRETVS